MTLKHDLFSIACDVISGSQTSNSSMSDVKYAVPVMALQAKECVMKIYLFHFQSKHMLWVLKRTVSMRRSFEDPNYILKLTGKKNVRILRSKNVFI